jgi:hypothetical protein
VVFFHYAGHPEKAKMVYFLYYFLFRRDNTSAAAVYENGSAYFFHGLPHANGYRMAHERTARGMAFLKKGPVIFSV